MYLKSLLVDRFLCLRCLNDYIELPDIIRSFTSGATASLVAKNGTKNIAKIIQKIPKIRKLKNPKIKNIQKVQIFKI